MEPFGLTIALGVVCSAHCCFTLQQFCKRLPEFRCESWIAIRHNCFGHAILAYPLLKQKCCDLFSVEILFDRNKLNKFTEPINDAKNCIVTLRLR